MLFSKKLICALSALLILGGCSSAAPEAETSAVSSAVTEPPAPEEAPVPSETSVTEAPETSPAADETEPYIAGIYGSAGKIDGTTLIVSIFADEQSTSWNNRSDSDIELQLRNLEALKTGAEWLSEKCSGYSANTEFILDWEQFPDLYRRASFKQQIVRRDSEMYQVQKNYILDEIDSAGLMKKYGADNIIYIFFFNTKYSNSINPWSLDSRLSSGYDLELINVFVRFKYFDTPPAAYAHELMHCFGACDLYYASEDIPQEYVDYCEQTGSTDIMFTVNSGDEILVDFTDLDAYYVGLIDSCPEVEEWDLVRSEYDRGE